MNVKTNEMQTLQPPTRPISLVEHATLALCSRAIALSEDWIMRESLSKLAPAEFTTGLFQNNLRDALPLLEPRYAAGDGQHNAESNYAAKSLRRALDSLDGSQFIGARQRRTLCQLRAHFVPRATNIESLRTDLAVALDRGRELQHLIKNSANAALRNQQYFIYCLVELLDKIDDCARDELLGRYLLDAEPGSARAKWIPVAAFAACLAGAGLYCWSRRT